MRRKIRACAAARYSEAVMPDRAKPTPMERALAAARAAGARGEVPIGCVIVAPDGTGYRESNTYGAGDQVVTYEADGVKVGCAICYDIRFPDLFWELRAQGAELIFLPSAFTLATGKDHWETLLKARAIETQCWFAAPATWGKHLEGKGAERFTYGHSLVVDPWGHVTAKVPDGVGWATARLDPKVTARVRRDMPVLEHRKRM